MKKRNSLNICKIFNILRGYAFTSSTRIHKLDIKLCMTLSRGIAKIHRIFVYRLSSSDNRSIRKSFVSSCIKQKKYITIRHKLYWSIVVVSVRILRDNSLIKLVSFININTHYKNLPICCILFGYYTTNIIAIYITPLNLRKITSGSYLIARCFDTLVIVQ